MWRRKFIGATAAVLVAPRRTGAQVARRRLGVLTLGPIEDNALLDGLQNRGWIDGQNLSIEFRRAQSQDRLPAFAAELVALRPDLLIAFGTTTAVALKSATATIPIVFVAAGNPVGNGLVQSLSRPGGNITGLSTLVPGFAAKEMQLLWEIVPTVSKIAVLTNPGNPQNRLSVTEEMPRAAQQLGVALLIVEATTAAELDIAFALAATQHADAIVVLGDPFHFRIITQVTALAAKHRLPAIYIHRIFVANGGLMSYGPDFADLHFRAGGFVDKILKGIRPSDLPVEQPTKFQLVVNVKTAKALGLTVPLSLLARADEVIE